MPQRSSGFEIHVGTKTAELETDEPKPFRIAIFGDFSGRANRGMTGGAVAARPVLIDRDNFNKVLAKAAPVLDLPMGGNDGPSARVTFSSLEDFHPDSLYARLPVFARLRDLRTRLNDPATFREAAAELTGARQEPAPSAPPAPAAAPPRPDVAAIAGGNLLDRMMDDSESAKPQARAESRPDELRQYINSIVAGHVVPGRAPEQDELLARVDSVIAAQLRALLHQPDFQSLEAAWRALFFLARRLETGVNLKVSLFDISKRELADDLIGARDLRATAFYRHVAADTVEVRGGEPWALLAGIYSFDASAADIELLARIAMVARQGGAPFLAAAEPGVLGCDALEGMPDPRDWSVDPTADEFWRTLRELPEAAYLGLALPRFLLRLPYGEDTDETEMFPFEEMPGTPAHEQYLWGNPAIAAVCMLGQAFASYGWQMRPGIVRDLSGLPLHTYQRDGEPYAQPCAEALLSDRAAESILSRGIMPLLSERDSDRILLVRFQSAAEPPQALAGRW
jgi:type VI secretion system protein ImpC